MTKKEKERTKYCLLAGCPQFRKCLVKWGKACIRNGGSKVPRFMKKAGETLLTITGEVDGDVAVEYCRGGVYYG